ncbi:MAG TPA: protein kinase, partial [Candidatus Methylomirabilis sp.]|nr:protein kinase [Candidatus Methylomirabilis sp.]
VYRAHDGKLGRDVALKVLPAAFAQNAERLARFEREARLLASLNHSGIASIYGIEESADERFLILELVPGETIAERLARGPLSFRAVLDVGRQIAEAMAAAHERGVIHRDLKPANIVLTPEGKAKILDFGLAKALEGERAPADLSQSPTVSHAGTREGLILGTAPYMSPEQARGEELDKRTDIWSFGCVLYELLTARRAFPGATVPDTIAAILEREPDWAALPETTPAMVRSLLRRCLQKDKTRRLHDIGDARLEIEEAQVGLSSGVGVPAAPAQGRRTAWLWIGLLTAAAAGLVAWLVLRATPSATPSVKRLAFAPPPHVALAGTESSSQHLVLSPQGDRVAFMGWSSDKRLGLYVQAINDIEAHAIPDTERGYNPFFSPDGGWLGFERKAQLQKVRLDGGTPVTIADIPQEGSLRGASWGPDGTIIFTPGAFEGLWRVHADGGTPRSVTTPNADEGETGHRWPQILPGGRDVLFTIHPGIGRHSREARIGMLSLETGRWQVVAQGTGYARYSPTGHLVYARLGTLFAVPFDLTRRGVAGSGVQVLDDVQMDVGATYYADFDISTSGSLVYVPGSPRPIERTLLWVDREGRTQPVTRVRRDYWAPRLSSDGQRLAATFGTDAETTDLWVLDLSRDAWTRLTSDPAQSAGSGEWSPDGRWLAFGTGQRLFRMPSDGSAPAQPLSGHFNNVIPNAWTPDGRTLVFTDQGSKTVWDIGVLTIDGGEPHFLLSTPANECCAALSPDGRFMAYVSTESGDYAVYVRQFPGLGGATRISTESGTQPRWSRNGRELFYRTLGDRPKLMSVAVETRGVFRAGLARPVFDDTFGNRDANNPAQYDVSLDGQRFLFIEEPPAAPAPTRIVLIPDWASELKAKLRAAQR